MATDDLGWISDSDYQKLTALKKQFFGNVNPFKIFANKHYNININININYSVLELANISDLKEEYSAIISFDAFEYIDSTSLFLPDIVRLLKNDRYFIVSTTNQEKLPFNIERFPYHIKHYTNNE
ncbi:hypothetical protein JD523_03205 [Aeromonas enteropelogenes]|uniref:hypothetical protein n=1 Tax=Aeromonas enteropelogenes TaxID=29489 RepID=UPI00191D6158|nr:hypothetical protein [Aeromonas enteropelogenes]MBL0519920.1 hypothetical protein [Aeromonas enteropelogenes]